MGEVAQKVLVITPEKIPMPKGVDSVYTHQDLPNLSEYDLVILNIATLTPVEAEWLFEDPNFTKETIHHLLWKGGELIIITNGKKEQLVGTKGGKYDWWDFFPVYVPLKRENGSEIKVIDENYKEYFATINTWSFYIKDKPKILTDYYSEIFSETERSKIEMYTLPYSLKVEIKDVIARNGAEYPIAFSIKYFINHRDKITGQTKTVKSSGKLTYLPYPGRDEINNGISAILKSRGKIGETIAPIWIESYRVPGEQNVKNQIAQYTENALAIEKCIKDEKINLEKLTKYKKVLYEQGTELQEIVHNIFDEFGFVVNREDRFKEDGWATDGTNYYVFEIKGKEGDIARRDLRELYDWIANFTYEKKLTQEPKGILIINRFRFQDPMTRTKSFPPDIDDYLAASKSKCVIITAEQLFDLYCQFKQNKISKKQVLEYFATQEKIFNFPNKN